MAPATHTMRSMGYGAASITRHAASKASLHAVRGRRHARRNASINKALIQIKAFGARANEHVACVFRLKHR